MAADMEAAMAAEMEAAIHSLHAMEAAMAAGPLEAAMAADMEAAMAAGSGVSR